MGSVHARRFLCRCLTPDPASPPFNWGIYCTSSNCDSNPANTYAKWEGYIGKTIPIKPYFWVMPGSNFNAISSILDGFRSSGSVPLLMLTTADYNNPNDWQNWTPATFAAGNHDTLLETWASQMSSWNHPIILRPWWEANNISTLPNMVPWMARVYYNGNLISDEDDWIAGWRHIHDIFNSYPNNSTNIKWMWSMLSWPAPGNPILMNTIYPGSDYVDIMGFEFYHAEQTGYTDPYQDPLIVNAYQQLCTCDYTKPIAIAESGILARVYKASWIGNALSVQKIQSHYPRVDTVFLWSTPVPGGTLEFDDTIDDRNATVAALQSNGFKNG